MTSYTGWDTINYNAVIDTTCDFYKTSSTSNSGVQVINGESYFDDFYYGLSSDGSFYKTYLVDNSEHIFDFYPVLDSKLIAKNIVKFNNDGYYLSKDGDLYNCDNEVIATNVTNISDNLYKVNNIWKYLDSDKEFKFDYATDYNVHVKKVDSTEYNYVYNFSLDEGIDYLIAPDDSRIEDGDTYSFYEDGYYLFNVVNKYGDTFTKTIIIDGIDNNLNLPVEPEIVNGVVKFSTQDNLNVLYSSDGNTWESFPKDGLSYTDSFLFKVENKDDILPIYRLTLDKGKVNIECEKLKGFNPNNFCGFGYIKYGNLYDINGDVLCYDVVLGAVYSENSYFALGQDSYFHSSYNKVFRSNKLRYENSQSTPVKAFMNGLYTYLIGDTGALVSISEGDNIGYMNGYGEFFASDWKEEWLTGDVSSWNNNGMVCTKSGDVYDFSYNDEFGRPVTDLKFYDEEGNEKQGVSIKAFRPTDGSSRYSSNYYDCGYTVLGSDNCIYTYSRDVDGLIFAIDLNDSKGIDYQISNTNWANDEIEIKVNVSDLGLSTFGKVSYEPLDDEWYTFKDMNDLYSDDTFLSDIEISSESSVDLYYYPYRYGSVSVDATPGCGYFINNDTGDTIYAYSVTNMSTNETSNDEVHVNYSDVVKYTFILPEGNYDYICSSTLYFDNLACKSDDKHYTINDEWYSFFDNI